MTVTTASLAYGLVVMFFSSVLCSSAGVGGGSLNVPILYSIIGFDYDTAVVLSLCTLMGNYLLQVLVNLDKRHPNEPRLPLIYWDAVLIIFPSLLGGANFGVVVAKSMPKTLVFLLAICVLVLAVYFTGKKGLMLRKKETLLIEEELNGKSYDIYSNHSPLLDNATDDAIEAPKPRHVSSKKAPIVTISSIIPPYLCCYYSLCKRFGTDKTGASKKSSKGPSSSTHTALNTSEVVTSFDEEDDYLSELSDPMLPPIEFPWKIISVIAVVFVMYLACYVVQKQYDQCTTGNNISLALIYVLLAFQITWGLRYLITQYNKKLSGAWADESLPGTASAHKGLVEGEIHWGLQSAVVPLASFLIGVTSSLLGIGGGELMGPMLLMFKVRICVLNSLYYFAVTSLFY